MRINGLPELACSTFLQSLKGKVIVLEPLSKFPVVKDLIVDRSVVFENLKKINLWLESDAYMTEYPIFRATGQSQKYKPDNRIAVNFVKYIVDTMNGFS